MCIRDRNKEYISFAEIFKYIATKPLLYVGHIIVFTAITILAYGTISWMPSLLVRVHHITTSQAGINLGLIMLFVGPLAVWTSSYLFDKFVKQNNINGIIGLIFIAIITLSIAAPLYANAPNLNSALFYSIFLIFGQSFPYGLASAVSVSYTHLDVYKRQPPERGTRLGETQGLNLVPQWRKNCLALGRAEEQTKPLPEPSRSPKSEVREYHEPERRH